MTLSPNRLQIMSTKLKSKSHEAAQKKLWRVEIRDCERAIKKLDRDFATEKRQRTAALVKAEKALAAEQKRFQRFATRMEKILPRSTQNLQTRIAILRGRISS